MFFPVRADREVLEWVLEQFPFPLAYAYQRLQEEMDQQDPVSATLQLRDTFEIAIKFVASIAVADLLRSRPSGSEARDVAALLLKPLSIGDWHALLEKALKPLEPLAREGRLSESGRLVPELFGVFYQTKGRLRPTAVHGCISGAADSFVNWRNRVIGHGAFRSDRDWYADQTTRWLTPLHDLCKELRPIFERWELVSRDEDGSFVRWQGTYGLPPPETHVHGTADSPRPVYLVGMNGEDSRSLTLEPLLSVSLCPGCQRDVTFFFDRSRYEREKDRHRTFVLEYFRAHDHEYRNWTSVRKLAELLPPSFSWERVSYDSAEVDGQLMALFRTYEREYHQPQYVVDRINQFVDKWARGYVHLVGPGGVGKSCLVRGLGETESIPGAVVLTYHILHGVRADYRTFVVEIAAQARERLRFRTQEVQVGAADGEDLPSQFVSFLQELMNANSIDTLILAIDGLDELVASGPQEALITSFLPVAPDLPDGCYIILTHRESVTAAVERDFLRIQGQDREDAGIARIDLSPQSEDNRDLLRTYLRDTLPESFRSHDNIETIIDRAGGLFLYVAHLAHALQAGAFAETRSLPSAAAFYPSYLHELRERIGPGLYESLYLPLLALLTAAAEPISREQLNRWGIPTDRLSFAILDLRDFLRFFRGGEIWDQRSISPEQPRYALAHEDFRRFLREDTELALRWSAANALIGQRAVQVWRARWTDIDPAESTDLYDLRFVLRHLYLARLPEAAQEVQQDATFPTACVKTAEILCTSVNKSSAAVALELASQAINVYEANALEHRADMVKAEVIRGTALDQLGFLDQAIDSYDRALAHYRSMDATEKAELDVTVAHLYFAKGVDLGRLGQLDQAVTSFDATAVNLHQLAHRGDPIALDLLYAALMNRGQALRLLGRREEALEAYEVAAEIAEVAAASNESDKQGVEERLRTAKALTQTGAVHFDMGNLDEALQSHNRALAITAALENERPDVDVLTIQVEALINRGVALGHGGRTADALASYREAAARGQAAISSGHSDQLVDSVLLALTNQGELLLDRQSIDGARIAFQQVQAIAQPQIAQGRAELLPHLARAYTGEARALRELGAEEEALDQYGRAVELWQRLHPASALHVLDSWIRTASLLLLLQMDLERWDDVARVLHDWLQLVALAYEQELPLERIARDCALVGHALLELAPERRDWLVHENRRYNALLQAILTGVDSTTKQGPESRVE